MADAHITHSAKRAFRQALPRIVFDLTRRTKFWQPQLRTANRSDGWDWRDGVRLVNGTHQEKRLHGDTGDAYGYMDGHAEIVESLISVDVLFLQVNHWREEAGLAHAGERYKHRWSVRRLLSIPGLLLPRRDGCVPGCRSGRLPSLAAE